jgi:hypothetical protein
MPNTCSLCQCLNSITNVCHTRLQLALASLRCCCCCCCRLLFCLWHRRRRHPVTCDRPPGHPSHQLPAHCHCAGHPCRPSVHPGWPAGLRQPAAAGHGQLTGERGKEQPGPQIGDPAIASATCTAGAVAYCRVCRQQWHSLLSHSNVCLVKVQLAVT